MLVLHMQHGDLTRMEREQYIDYKIVQDVVGTECRGAQKAVQLCLGHFRFEVKESLVVGVSCAHMRKAVVVARSASFSFHSAVTVCAVVSELFGKSSAIRRPCVLQSMRRCRQCSVASGLGEKV